MPARTATAKRSRAKRAAREPSAARRARAGKILAELKRLYPDAECALHHKTAFELLVATILSAQSTDANVNRVTPVLFAKYPDPQAFARADPADLEQIVHSTGFFRQKTKSILGAARRIVEAYGGSVPDTMDDLVTLPGVARKTANVILGTWFGKNCGVVVDTHVGRLAHRMGLTWSSKGDKDAVKIEGDLVQVIPQDDWTLFGHAMIHHGRRVCSARKPNCAGCAVSAACPSAFAVESRRKKPSAGRRASRRARRRR